MLTSNYTFLYPKNNLYCKPVKGFQGCGVGYCFSFNGQEKDDEVSGAGNIMTAEYWELDSRLGRRWNVDPRPNAWESEYSIMGGNPILRTDVLGDKWKEPKDAAMAERLNNKLEIKKNRYKKRADKFEEKALGEKNFTKAFDLLGKSIEAREGEKQMAMAQSHLAAIGEPLINQEYTFKKDLDPNKNVSNTYMDANGTIVMEYSGDANAIHEIKHGFQQLVGEVEYLKGTDLAAYTDLYDEVAAYKMQYFFDPFSVSRLTTNPNTIEIVNSNSITPAYVESLVTSNGKKIYQNFGKTRDTKFHAPIEIYTAPPIKLPPQKSKR